MGLLRSVPLKNSSTDLPFLKEVDFETLRILLVARDLTQPAKAASNGGGSPREANHNPGSHLPHFIGMPENRRKLQAILNSSRKNNVWLIGSKGIGKTTLVEDYIREKARGRVDAELATKPVFIFGCLSVLIAFIGFVMLHADNPAGQYVYYVGLAMGGIFWMWNIAHVASSDELRNYQKMFWLIIVISIPVLGGFIYLFMHQRRNKIVT